MRLMSPRHALQAARHFVCWALLRHLQKAAHGSALPAQAVPNPNGLSTTPAKTAPSRRNDSRRGTDSANDLENSSNKLSMIDPRFCKKVVVTIAGVSAFSIDGNAFAGTKFAGELRGAYVAARAAIAAVPIQVGAVAVRFRAYPVGTVRR
jgi:hypothetical protein